MKACSNPGRKLLCQITEYTMIGTFDRFPYQIALISEARECNRAHTAGPTDPVLAKAQVHVAHPGAEQHGHLGTSPPVWRS